MAYALDYTSERHDYDAMKARGVVGMIRYTKYITSSEANAIRAAGMQLALVEETTANMTNGGHAAGVERGRHANAVADMIGFPKDRPIFYAVDHDAPASEYDTIEQFLLGAASTGRPAEVYGHTGVCNAMFDRGFKRPWQCYAWSHHTRSPHAVLFQRLDNPTGLSGVDVNDILAADWGQESFVPPHDSSHPESEPPIPTPPKDEEDMIEPQFVATDDPNAAKVVFATDTQWSYFYHVKDEATLLALASLKQRDGHVLTPSGYTIEVDGNKIPVLLCGQPLLDAMIMAFDLPDTWTPKP